MCGTVGLLIICISLAVEPNQIGFRAPFPGEFFGNSTSPASCFGGTVRYCDIISNPLTDGDYADTLDRVYSSKFIAWGESSQFHLIAHDNNYFHSIKTINLFFYHNQMLGMGLPRSVNISFSTSDIDEGIIREYTIIGNQDLVSGDSKVRNVTLVLTENIVGDASRFYITFSRTNGPQVFALSEVELCSNTGIVVFL